ncbi:transketolase [Rhodothalassium salexigens DSM 2132]|uniref:Transketolase n=1 Tax=Rhodothalassium salexigens DSM 2132 TaxID=1188247 RepID=A0A4R2PPR1_RHOSA|nr:transketolase [Rhodothalassium salexigens]MBB4210808.1 transketolase [Rhodothalassium salexigens DSM 2132]MBK1639431.1 transketolase [Rhodothalassium salexigens DSM 2132]TCP37637.1 transketolase [Rhodothalassium salexigens DSM 2132]
MTDTLPAGVSHADLANAIRALSMDAVERAQSGHPGMPMGMADVATVLFTRHLKFDPAWPQWPDRDRFVLSAGHGSMLLYALLHLTGYERPTLDDIKNFRQLGSPCAGHPEAHEPPGVETTTGPLGQGLATAVGMAMAERLEAARTGDAIADHHTYVIAGDGCLMEGISHEAASMAGHMKLSKLVVLFDDNGISIDGATDLAVSDDQMARFAAYGWHTQAIDGHDPDAIDRALTAAKADPRPSIIACKTTIGFGADKKAGTAAAHGAPLGEAEIAHARAKLGWDHPPFEIPDAIRDAWCAVGARGAALSRAWSERLEALPQDARADFERRQTGETGAALADAIAGYKRAQAETPEKVATRKASQAVLEVINQALDLTIGGSADLTGSNNTKTGALAPVTPDDFSGRYIHYGVREFAMAAAMNGIALHGGFIPYGGTFLVFSDYARPAIRLSALMGQRVVYVLTHDSIGLGEDGPTHQPIEQLMSLRVLPNCHVFRPADAVETAECWQAALERTDGPSVLALTRQGLTPQRCIHTDDNLSARGGYVLREETTTHVVTLIATGSEVEIAMDAAAILEDKGVGTRVVSMPCTERFDAQDGAYRGEVLGHDARLYVSIEAGSTQGWERYVGVHGLTIGIDSFGASGPYKDLYRHFGLTPDAVVEAVTARL